MQYELYIIALKLNKSPLTPMGVLTPCLRMLDVVVCVLIEKNIWPRIQQGREHYEE
jgi:hypothetical protein